MKHASFVLTFGVLFSGTLSAQEKVDYLRDIKPIFTKNCTMCHGAEKQRSGLRLDSASHALEGSNEGPVIVAGKSAASKLIKAVSGAKDAPRMPPENKGKLSAPEIAMLKAWIDQGAKAPAGETTAVKEKDLTHWAFVPPQRSALPAVKNVGWVRNSLDHFILARLEKDGIAPSPEADRITLIRRVTLDLTGLPPSPKEVESFLNNTRPGAYERVVDRLLASPHYGERWARHWLDLARYADSNGFNIDAPRSIWPYRDWVIAALNKDLPFDQFVIQQIAGDLLPGNRLDSKVATGFHRNTLLNQEGGIDVEQFRVEAIVDRVNTTGTVFLGMTVGCAQCHDHKYDPFSQKEYYQLFAFFNNCEEPTLPLPTPAETKETAALLKKEAGFIKQLEGLDTTSEAKRIAWEKSLLVEVIAQFPSPLREILEKPDRQRTREDKIKLSIILRELDQVPQLLAGLGNPLSGGLAGSLQLAGHLHVALFRANLEDRIAKLKQSAPAVATTLILQERPTPRVTNVHIQGDFLRKGKRVLPEVPETLPALPKTGVPNRLDLARWLADPKNPLTARVTVNRYWQQFFGLGIVETENDFGTQGTPPSHPELLDWLALEFMSGTGRPEAYPTENSPWSIKQLHRLIVTSAAYRQSSQARPDLAVKDPRNRLLARQNRLRLEAEVVRDVTLAVSGLLNPKIGGPSVFPYQPDGVFAFTQIQREWKASDGRDRYRRGMYTHFWRSSPYPALMAFDSPDSTSTCTRRNRSNTPLQALTLLNDKAFFEFAQGLAVRVLKESKDDGDRLNYIFRLCLSRPPSAREYERLTRLLEALQNGLTPEETRKLAAATLPNGTDVRQAAAWTMLGRVLLNLDEFITRE